MGTNFGMTGVETFILQLCAAERRSGLVPSIAIDLINREEVRTVAERCGVTVYDLADPPVAGAPAAIERAGPSTKQTSGRLGELSSRVQRVRRLRQLLHDADVIHIHAVGISCIDGFVARALSRGKALIVTHHATLAWFAPYRNLVSDVTFWLEKRLSDRVVMPYAVAIAEFVAHGIPESRSRVIPFCVDDVLFCGLAPMPAPGELTVVMSARMFKGKGHLELLSAIAALLPRYPKLRGVLIGDGPSRPEIEASIDRLGLRDVVECKGRVDHGDVPASMRQGHVIVLPSYMEGEMFPLCLMEGMALGLPAIGTRIAGIPEIIADGETGILVEPRDQAGLTRAIERFLSDPAFYAQARASALARFKSRFSAAAVARAYRGEYEEALRELAGGATRA
jgi:glycosyltransferase involved in cell wall biosynthesis